MSTPRGKWFQPEADNRHERYAYRSCDVVPCWGQFYVLLPKGVCLPLDVLVFLPEINKGGKYLLPNSDCGVPVARVNELNKGCGAPSRLHSSCGSCSLGTEAANCVGESPVIWRPYVAWGVDLPYGKASLHFLFCERFGTP